MLHLLLFVFMIYKCAGTTAEDGCTTSIECRHGSKTQIMFQTENSCPKPLMEDKVDGLKGEVLTVQGKVDTVEVQGKVDSIEATVDELKLMLKQLIPKSGNLI